MIVVFECDWDLGEPPKSSEIVFAIVLKDIIYYCILGFKDVGRLLSDGDNSTWQYQIYWRVGIPLSSLVRLMKNMYSLKIFIYIT